MSWCRIDDKAMEHPKISKLSDGAFRLWVEGLVHCQKYLTDGAITVESMRGFKAYSPKRKGLLLDARLWDGQPDGSVHVHDYLQWNESKEQVLKSRQIARERLDKHRQMKRVSPVQGEIMSTPHHTTPHPIRPTEQAGDDGGARARSKRPIFRSERFVVFEWMLDDLRKLLGPHFEAFDVHAWFFELAERANREGLVVPQRDGGKWLSEQTLREAQRRGLMVAAPTTSHPKTAGNLAAAAQFIARGKAAAV